MLTLSKYLKEVLGLSQSKSDPCVFHKCDKDGTRTFILDIDVEKIMICGSGKKATWKNDEIVKRSNIDKL